MELLPCPFCGGDAYLSYRDDGLADNGEWVVFCGVAKCDARIEKDYILGGYGRSTKKGAKTAVIAAWNRRTNQTINDKGE